MPPRHRHALAAAPGRRVGLGPRLLAAGHRPLPFAVRACRRRRPLRRGRRVRCRPAARPALRPGLRLDRRDQLDPVDRPLARGRGLAARARRPALSARRPSDGDGDRPDDRSRAAPALSLRRAARAGDAARPADLLRRRHAGRARDHARVVARPRRDRPGRARRRPGACAAWPSTTTPSGRCSSRWSRTATTAGACPRRRSACRSCSRCRRSGRSIAEGSRPPRSPCPEAASRRGRPERRCVPPDRGKASWPFASPGWPPSRSSRCSTFPTKPSPPSAPCASSPTIRGCRAA